MQAAVLIEKLKICEDEIAARNRVAERYARGLGNVVTVSGAASSLTVNANSVVGGEFSVSGGNVTFNGNSGSFGNLTASGAGFITVNSVSGAFGNIEVSSWLENILVDQTKIPRKIAVTMGRE